MARTFVARTSAHTPLQVVVPRTYLQYTSRRVLTTEWLEGEKLSQSKADDVGDLVRQGPPAGRAHHSALIRIPHRSFTLS